MTESAAATRLPPTLSRYAWLSVAAALSTMALKLIAWWLTGSVGLLSDAAEASVNLLAASFAVFALRVAALPDDDNHQYGHGKIDYFAGGYEGGMILLAAATIGYLAIDRLLHPAALEQIGFGVVFAALASLINLAVGLLLLRVGRKHRSLTLEADGHHLLTDVWTSVGVLVGLGLVALTGWWWLDPLVALLVAAHILITGVGLLRRAIAGLMDEALSTADHDILVGVLNRLVPAPLQWHALRHRQSGRQGFATVHVLVPDEWTVRRAHDLSEDIEDAVAAALPSVHISIHLEPLGDPRAYTDHQPHQR
ncbi:cation transporter [Permianibacter sp. IMCC34836]|uniref:cation diffusion facilitator family transporter n=1 Tax=Permianibacter fluminis TaxID=2738515 RepID=UPI001554ABC9|nr:cation diffusion facilitator family transporter [Permianibacter fluminis]NQD35503.1 cation transporter [Permianibacter fluminis]